MFELSSQAANAGTKVAIEWAKLEAQGYEPAAVACKPVEQLSEPELKYLRAYQHFNVVAQQCMSQGVRIPLRYATFHASGGASNPGVLPPTLPMLALALLLTMLALVCTGMVDVGSATLPPIAISVGLVALGWERIWAFGEYAIASIQEQSTRHSR